MRCLSLAALAVALGGCSSALQTLPLDASAAPGAARPAGVAAASEALGACAGRRFDAARVLLECLDDQQVYLIRYAAEPDAATCRRLAAATVGRGLAPGPAPGPALPLPARSETFAASLRLSGAAEAEPAVVACVPAAGGGLPPGLDAPERPDTVDVFGRGLAVHPSCRLLEPRNLQCESDGQMSWTRYSTAEAAAAGRDRHARRILDRSAEVLSDERVGCRFEGVRTECRRITARVSFGTVGRLLTAGQSDRLVAVLAAADVRGQHAQAECSFFDDQAAPGALAVLCREAFEID